MRTSTYHRSTETRTGTARSAGILAAALLCGALTSCAPDAAPDAAPEKALTGSLALRAEAEQGDPSAAAAHPEVQRLDPSESPLPYPTFVWPPTEDALAAGFDSPTEVAWMAIQAIDRDDKPRMRALLVDERTYLEEMWPCFEAEKPGNTIPGQFHWDHLEMKSLAGIVDMTREFAGKGYRLRVVTYEFEKEYGTFKLYRHTRVIVEDPLTGKSEELRFFGDILEIDGKHKLLSYPS